MLIDLLQVDVGLHLWWLGLQRLFECGSGVVLLEGDDGRTGVGDLRRWASGVESAARADIGVGVELVEAVLLV